MTGCWTNVHYPLALWGAWSMCTRTQAQHTFRCNRFQCMVQSQALYMMYRYPRNWNVCVCGFCVHSCSSHTWKEVRIEDWMAWCFLSVSGVWMAIERERLLLQWSIPSLYGRCGLWGFAPSLFLCFKRVVHCHCLFSWKEWTMLNCVIWLTPCVGVFARIVWTHYS